MHALIKLTYITGKIWLPYDPEESDEDSKMRKKYLIDELGIEDDEDYSELSDKVMKVYGPSFEDPRLEAWRRRDDSRRFRSGSPASFKCFIKCTLYANCILHSDPERCSSLKGSCHCWVK